jgi:hypothetical protein
MRHVPPKRRLTSNRLHRRVSQAKKKNRVETLLATCFHTGFLLGFFFGPEDGCDMFLRNVGWLQTDYIEE